jgi:hypothetical protein
VFIRLKLNIQLTKCYSTVGIYIPGEPFPKPRLRLPFAGVLLVDLVGSAGCTCSTVFNFLSNKLVLKTPIEYKIGSSVNPGGLKQRVID